MTEDKHNKEVSITVDHKHLKSKTPTSGAALYTLGAIQAGHTLYQEESGPHDDPPVPNDGTEIHLHEGEKFYSEPGQPQEQKEVEIVIDRKHLISPKKTTEAALYLLGAVPAGYELYRETSGPAEDEPIPNNGTPIRLHQGEKFYSSPGQVTPGAGV
jgi:hypothetical protein